MLTVRHIEESGAEDVLETEHVTFCPKQPEMTRECVFVETKNGSSREINTGQVFVMNENGKTVAIYRFSDIAEVPTNKAIPD